MAPVLRHGFALTAIGPTVGLAGAAAVTRYLQGMLFGVTPVDPKTFAAISLAPGRSLPPEGGSHAWIYGGFA